MDVYSAVRRAPHHVTHHLASLPKQLRELVDHIGPGKKSGGKEGAEKRGGKKGGDESEEESEQRRWRKCGKNREGEVKKSSDYNNSTKVKRNQTTDQKK